MFYTYNKSNNFYYYNIEKDKHVFIGDKTKFINFLAKNINFYSDNYNSRWNCKLLDSQNITGNDLSIIHYIDTNIYPKEKVTLRPIIYYDGNFRIINIRNYLDDALIIARTDNIQLNYKYIRCYNPYKCKKRHSGYQYYNKPRHTYRTKRLNSIPEYKQYIKVRSRDKELPVWWDDTLRKVSCCWKDQRKFKKQFKADSKSIRYNSYDDEKYDIDALLEEDFLK